ncbi:MAG: tryptophan-rich sensory protein [Candidatus Syntrophonatronum acetioxidans]|uniref:Tryptophan-rich sensory protein n=1 Tax=Candidatus Syntrophonatronum acetioxidans TaxID=1795816 RepID=A0A424YGT8_9FIRM|nr:MAG: tryptophan-rich sensory protein [Candidatus Syntrophonatronum acetioxidans]
MNGKRRFQALNLLGFIGMVIINYLANALPLNNMTTGELSDLYPNLFTPAGFTFSIWGVIYLLLLGFSLYQARDIFSFPKVEMPFLYRIGYLFFISSLLNGAWIFAWHYTQIFASMAIMVALLLVLIMIYLNLGIGERRVSSQESFWVHLPFQVYLGWITIATIANASALLVHVGWGRFGLSESFWTVLMIGVAALLTIAFLTLRQDLAVSLVSLWAILGIAVKRITLEPVVMPVFISAVVAMIIISIFFFRVWSQKRAPYGKIKGL